jgi:hypothetical protein
MSVGRAMSFALEPWRGRVDFVALGGDHDADQRGTRSEPELGWLSERAIPRFFTVPGVAPARARVAAPRLYSAELITK